MFDFLPRPGRISATGMNIVQSIRDETRSARDHVAMVEGQRRVTYAQLLDGVTVLRQSAGRTGELAPDSASPSAVATESTTSPAPWRCWNAGRRSCPWPIRSPTAKSRRRSNKWTCTASSRTPACHEARQQTLSACSGQSGEKIDAAFVWFSRRANGELDQRCREMGAAFIRFSSGTTGSSKGVVLSHRAILERTDAADRGLQITPADVVLWVLGMSHHFVVSILLFLRRGATIVVANHDFPFSLFEAVARSPVTFIYASPVHYHLLSMADSVAKTALSRVRLAISTAMKMPPDISRAFSSKFGFAPAEAYGIIEIGLPFINRQSESGGEGTVGHILPDYQLQIRHPDGEGIGEVLVRGKGMFDAYYSPWRTCEQCLEGGWFPTGDLGKLDAQGRLVLLGRCKTVIVCAGMKVFPEEVEAVINALPGVVESLVFAQEHPQFGQVPVARVVLAKQADAANMIEQLRRHCCRQLSAFKAPVEFRVVASLAKTTSGNWRGQTSLFSGGACPACSDTWAENAPS